jgi:hypothetical protein
MPTPRRAALAGIAAAMALLVCVSAYLPRLAEDKRRDALAAVSSDPRQAAEDAALARRLDPYSLDALFTASSIAMGRGDRDGALEPLLRATKIEPDSQDAWRRLEVADLVYGLPFGAAEAELGQLRSDTLSRFTVKGVAAKLFVAEVPPTASPTAYGTPP